MLSTRCQQLLRNLLEVKTVNGIGIGGSAAASISISAPHCRASKTTYYDALGITSASTQTDIKSAYYKLSMLYHPDKNQGSESAAKKFREISQAYEVLGNYRLRRLYDKGIINPAGSQFAQRDNVVYEEAEDLAPEDDPSTKFYKSRFRKKIVVDAKGRTPIYDFDEWSRAHYGKSFERKQAAKSKFDRKQTEKERNVTTVQNEIVIYAFAFCLIAMYGIFFVESSYDTPKNKALKSAAEKQRKTEEGT